jgi:REP element-mobilizing transposase RayT
MGRSDLRKGRFSQANVIYSITFTTKNRLPVLDFSTGRIIARLLLSPAIVKDHKILAWVIMPDHVHILIQLGESQTLSRFIQSLKSVSSRHINFHNKIWADGFFDRALRKEEDIRTVARYIVSNPIRAGLVKSVREYPLWNAVWL